MRLFIGKIKSLNKAFFNNNDNAEFFRASIIILSLKILFALSAFLTSVLIARYLSLEDAGHYFLMVSVVLLLSTVSRSGLDNAITRYIALANTNTEASSDGVVRVFSYSMRRALVGAFIVSVGWGGYYYGYDAFNHTEYNERFIFYAILFILPLTNILVVFSQSFQGLKRMFLFASIGNGVSAILLLLLLVVIAIQQSFTLLQLALCYIAALTLMLCFAATAWRKLFRVKYYSTEAPTEITKFKASCQQLWGVACLAIVMGQGAQVLLGLLSDSEQVAYFAIANRIAMLISFVLLAVNGALAPKFSELDVMRDKSRLEKVYRSSTILMIIVTFPILLSFFIFSELLLSMFGADYQQALWVVRILIVAQFIKVLVGSVGQLLVMSGYERIQRNILFVSVIILVLSSILLVPIWGAIGGAWSAFLAITINNLLGFYMVHAKLNITLFSAKLWFR